MKRMAYAMIIPFVLMIPQGLYADCRWVLWQRTQDYSFGKTGAPTPWQPEWEAIEDMQTGADCNRAKDKLIARLAKGLKKPNGKLEVVGNRIISITLSDGENSQPLVQTSITLNCYPGGFDPRPAQER